jgi:arylsulfatase A-like enzyme
MRTLFFLLIFATTILFSCQTKPQQEDVKPNIIFILADDLGYGDVGFNGGNKILTPTLDQMANEGMVFNRHYSGSTVCGPSRSCLMHGLHTGHAPVRENPRWTKSGKPVDMTLQDVTIAEELKRAGYTTAVIGKWGLAEKLDEGMPLKQGFDYFYGFCTHGAAHHYYPEEIWENNQHIKLEGNVMMDKKGKYTQDLFIDKALKFIDENKENPFFLYFTPTIPHYELTVPEEYKDYYYKQNWPLRKMKLGHYRHDENGYVTYASMVTRLDKDIDRILEQLKQLGIDENTLVIFTSDNGHAYDNVKDEFLNSNGDFRGKKRDLYEGGVHVPFVARWPGTIKSASSTNHVSAFWDLLPTLCDIAGIQPSVKTDGISYLPALTGIEKEQKKHDYLYWEFNEGRGPIQAVLKDQWKLVKFYGKNAELYNLDDDISEQKNITGNYPDKTKQLEQLMNSARTDHPEFPIQPHSRLKKKK